MVSVRGQIETAPLLDIASVRQEYWARKEVMLPSLKDFHTTEKPGLWSRLLIFFGLRKQATVVPKIILRRLSEEEWGGINERFWKLKEELVKRQPTLTKLLRRMSEGKNLTKAELVTVHNSHRKALPIYLAMLECMIEEPKMDYAGVQMLVDAVDDFDRDTLMSYVNMMTAQKAETAKKIFDERSKEMKDMESEVLRKVVA